MRRREPDFGRALRVGLAVSVVVHLVLLVVLGGALRSGEGLERDRRPGVSRSEGLQGVAIREEPARARPIPVPPPPTREEAPAEEGGEPAAEAVGEPAPGGRETGLTNAERLQPREGDRRLWLAPVEGPLSELELRRYSRADSALRDLLGAYLDSLRLTAEQERRAREWVFGEGDGAWGVTPDGLVLGGDTIPIPFGQLFSQGGEQAREARQALRDWNMIQQQALEQAAEQELRERLEAIRERTRAQRERGRDDTTGSQEAEADTTRANAAMGTVRTPREPVRLTAGWLPGAVPAAGPGPPRAPGRDPQSPESAAARACTDPCADHDRGHPSGRAATDAAPSPRTTDPYRPEIRVP